MSTVVPKLLYSPFEHRDVPVWEITTSAGRKIYYERVDYKGLIPIGMRETSRFGSIRINVFDVVKTPGRRMPKILREKDGYQAPLSWYEKDKNYTGPVSTAVRMYSELKFDDDDAVDDVAEDAYSEHGDYYY